MHRQRLLALALSVLVVATVIAAVSTRPALAVGSQIRTFVASTGSDANPCTRVAPCRTFAAALAQTAHGGEVVALDSGGYGTLTITQSVTITAAPGVQAFIAPSTGTAISVTAYETETVVLRNLILSSQGASYGVVYDVAVAAGGSLHIENLTITGFAVNGIYGTLDYTAQLYVSDTVVRGSGTAGINLRTSIGTAHATIIRTQLLDNTYGLLVGDRGRATVKDTVASGGGIGFVADPNSAYAEIDLEGCVASGNFVGISGSGNATSVIRVSNCTVTDNVNGISVGPNNAILSRGNNTVEGNTVADGTFSGTYSAK